MDQQVTRRLAAHPRAAARGQRGVTLVETVLVIAIGGVVLASIAGAIAWAGSRAVDAWPVKQSLAVAESLLGEVALKPFTRCDADGPPPPGTTACSIDDAAGPEAGESRFSYASPFDHPGDYDGFAMPSPPGIRTLDGSAVGALRDYAATVAVQPQALDNVPAADGLWVTVTVTGPGGTSVRLQTFRARYAP